MASLSCGEKIGGPFSLKLAWRMSTTRTRGIFWSSTRSGSSSRVNFPFLLLELPERVDDQKMPRVRVVDMRQASFKEKGPPIFSPQLKEAITQRLERKEQTILFLNRRGYS